MICDQYPEGFTIDSFIDSLPLTIVIGHPMELKVNLDTLIWLCGNTIGTMARGGIGHLHLDEFGAFIKYLRSSVS